MLLRTLLLLLLCTPFCSIAQTAYTYDEIDSLMRVAYSKGDFEKAADYMQLGRTKAEEIENAETPGVYLKYSSNLAFFLIMLERYETAEKIFLEIKKIEEDGLINKPIADKTNHEHHRNYSTTINNLASLYLKMEKYEQAEPLFLQAKDIRAKVVSTKDPKYISTLNNLAFLYQKLGRLKDAERLYQKVLELNEATVGKQDPKYASTLNNLALLYKETEQFEAAEKLYKQAIGIIEKVLGKTHPQYSTTKKNIGDLYVLLENYQAAEAAYLEAHKTSLERFGKQSPKYARILNSLAALYKQVGRLEEAKTLVDKVIVAMSKSNDSTLLDDISTIYTHDFYAIPQVIDALNNWHEIALADYHINKQQATLQQGYEALQMAVRLTEKIRNNQIGSKDKLRSLQQMSSFVEDAIATGTLLADQTDHNYINESFSFAERNKSILLTDAIKGQRARQMGDLPDSLVLYEIKLQKKKKKLQKAEIESQRPEQKKAIRAQLNKINEQMDAFLSNIKAEYPKYHSLKYENITATVADIQSSLQEGHLVLEYFVGDTVTYLFVVGKEEVELFPIPIQKRVLKNKVQQLRKALSNYTFIVEHPNKAYQLFIRQAAFFYKTFIHEAIANKEVKHLNIITDGVLGYLPFEVFLVEAASQKATSYKELHYLIKDYNISYNYSATLWKENLTEKERDNNHQVFACAADYEPVDSIALYKHRRRHVAERRTSLTELPDAAQEVTALAALFEGNFLQGKAVNEAHFKQTAKDYGVIHLAMHGVLHPRVPMLSSLAFTEDMDSLEDNFLQAYEISQLKLNADLVVLSACETGYGKFEQGEGIVSLARSFMYAGTPSLVVSLWQVNDLATALIMQLFYQKLADGLPKDIAMRQAKLAYIKRADNAAAHPAYWSPFIQLGDSRAVELQTSGWSSTSIGLMGGGVLLLLIGGLYVMRKRGG